MAEDIKVKNPYGHQFYVQECHGWDAHEGKHKEFGKCYECDTPQQALEAVRRLLNTPSVIADHNAGIHIDFAPQEYVVVDTSEWEDFGGTFQECIVDPFYKDDYVEPWVDMPEDKPIVGTYMPEGEPIVGKYMREV